MTTRYNTKTASLVGFWSNSSQVTDFAYESEALYLSKGGKWFILKKGGPYSSCGHRIGNAWCGGIAYEAIDSSLAKAWLERHSQGSDEGSD